MSAVLTDAAGGSGTTLETFNYQTAPEPFEDDFVGGSTTSGSVGKLGWYTGNGSSNYRVSEANHPGIFRRDTSSSAGTIAHLNLVSATGSGQNNGFLGGTRDMTFVVRLNTNDTDTAARVGDFQTANNDPPSSGDYFEKLYADTNWFYVTRNGTVQTGSRTDTGIAVSTGWITFRINRASDASIDFYINGTLIGSQTANIPTSMALNPGLQIVNQSAASKTIDIDYAKIIVAGISR